MLLALALGITPATAGYYKDLSLPRYWQDDACWCSAAATEMWIDWENGWSWDSSRQSEIASEYDIDCSGGLNSNDFANVMEDYTPNFYSDVSGSESTISSRIASEIKSGVPVAVVAWTRYNTKSWVANQHWLIVDAFENTTSSYSSTWSKIDGYWVNDPAYGSGITYVDAVSPSTEIDRADFFDYYASAGTGSFYLVQD